MSGTRIISVTAREVYSDRMHAAVQATVSTENGAVGKALIGDGISVGSHESPFLYDGGRRFAGRGMTCAAEKIVQVIAPMLIGLEADNQAICDAAILACGKDSVGANATAAVSTAVLLAGANARGIPVYKHLGGIRAITLPIPAALAVSGSNRYGNSVSCGYKTTYCFVAYDFPTYTEASSALWEVYMNWSDFMQERLSIKMQPIAGMAIPKGKLRDDYMLWEMLAEVIERSGYSGRIGLQVDMAANCFYDAKRKIYRGLFSEEDKDRRAMIETVVRMTKEYPFVIIEDPLFEDDFEGFAEITRRTDIQITGDDLIATQPQRLKKAISMKAGNALRVVTSQIGTVSECAATVQLAQEHRFGVVPCGERGEGLTACDYAVAYHAGSAHEYGMCYSGNRLLQIEQELGRRARFLGKAGIQGKRFQIASAY